MGGADGARSGDDGCPSGGEGGAPMGGGMSVKRERCQALAANLLMTEAMRHVPWPMADVVARGTAGHA
eukprot:5324483-Prymnesium_polylepis.1